MEVLRTGVNAILKVWCTSTGGKATFVRGYYSHDVMQCVNYKDWARSKTLRAQRSFYCYWHYIDTLILTSFHFERCN